MIQKKVNIAEVYNICNKIEFFTDGYYGHQRGEAMFQTGNSWFEVLAANLQSIKNGEANKLLLASTDTSFAGGYTIAGTEVYISSTLLKNGVLIELETLNPTTDNEGWAYHEHTELIIYTAKD